MTFAPKMRRLPWLVLAASLTLTTFATLTISNARSAQHIGLGAAYAILGNLPVQHRNRVKPLGVMASEEVELIHGRPVISLSDSAPQSTWEPVAAVLDWSARPKFWDDQKIILVENSQLREMLLRASIRNQLRAAAESGMPRLGGMIQELDKLPNITHEYLTAMTRQVGEGTREGVAINALASELKRSHKWLSPRTLETCRLDYEGRSLSFPLWVSETSRKKERIRYSDAGRIAALSPVEEEATKVGERYFHYEALRDHISSANDPLDLLVVPRPSNGEYRKYSAKQFVEGMESDRSLSPFAANIAHTLADYLQSIDSKNWALPGEDPGFDQKFVVWLNTESPWVPLGVLIGSTESELSHAGLPLELCLAVRRCYRDLEVEGRTSRGNLTESAATALIDSLSNLGAALGRYPDSIATKRESKLFRFNPFSKAVIAYGVAVLMLICSLREADSSGLKPENFQCRYYSLGLAGLASGIALELYGFIVRFRISQWGPVTNFQDSVVWLALATSLSGLALELLWKRRHAALAAGGVAFLAAVLSENIPALEPRIREILPVLRMNRWIFGHVLPIVSSYAAFSLALALGLMGLSYHLAARYRGTTTYRDLAMPLLAGSPFCIIGGLGLALSDAYVSPEIQLIQLLTVASWCFVVSGSVLAIAGGFAVLGEFVSRSPRRAWRLGLAMLSVGVIGTKVVVSDAVQNSLVITSITYGSWLVGTLGVALAVMSVLVVRSSDAIQKVEHINGLINLSIQAGVILLTIGMVFGAIWAHSAWDRYWNWDPKEVLALITLLTYCIALHGRFAGWLGTFGLLAATAVCFHTVWASWYGLNFVYREGLHSYGFADSAGPSVITGCPLALIGFVGASYWRRRRSKAC